uniref:Organic solute transporter subunit alpha-like n=1 Tax=Saccoglossus kowalevskii TaxID=10224 RepID=A0ABM0LXM0_SACKO|nr:PREDICTED: organic solute transporter subunit alpha-like [Saccoglossus kowalevskii]
MVASTDSFPASNQSDVTADDIVIADRFEAMVFDNCSEEDILAETMFTEVRVAGIIMLTIATILTVLMVVLYLEAIRFMQENIPAHRRRTRLTWLLGAYPVSSVLSLIGLYIPGTSTILNLSISLYLAIAYYQFCLLIADYYGGYHTMVAKLKHANISLAAPPLCCCCRCLPSYRATEYPLTLSTLPSTVSQQFPLCVRSMV